MKATIKPTRIEQDFSKVTDDERTEKFDDKLDLYKYMADIHSRIKNDISSDFVLAKLEDKDKEAIVEMTVNAYFSKKIIDYVAKAGYKWKWDINKRVWVKTDMDEKTKTSIETIGKALFDSFMNRLYMIAVLNRNKKNNYILDTLTGVRSDDEAVQEEVKESTWDKLKSKIQDYVEGGTYEGS